MCRLLGGGYRAVAGADGMLGTGLPQLQWFSRVVDSERRSSGLLRCFLIKIGFGVDLLDLCDLGPHGGYSE